MRPILSQYWLRRRRDIPADDTIGDELLKRELETAASQPSKNGLKVCVDAVAAWWVVRGVGKV